MSPSLGEEEPIAREEGYIMEPTEARPTALQVDGSRVAPAEGEMERELFAAIRAKNKEGVRELLEKEAGVNVYEPVPRCKIFIFIIGLTFFFIGFFGAIIRFGLTECEEEEIIEGTPFLCRDDYFGFLFFIILGQLTLTLVRSRARQQPIFGFLCFSFIQFIIPIPILPLLPDTNYYKKTPLHVAVTTGDSDMVALLLEFGADRNAPAAFMNCCCCKKTPLQFIEPTGEQIAMTTGDVLLTGEQIAPIKALLME